MSAVAKLDGVLKVWKARHLLEGRGATTVEPAIWDGDTGALKALPESGNYGVGYAVYLYQFVGGLILTASVKLGAKVVLDATAVPSVLGRLDRAHLAMVAYLDAVMRAAMAGKLAPQPPPGVGIITDGDAFPVPHEFAEETVAA